MRVIIDTNVMVSIFPRKSLYRWIYEKFLNGEFELSVSTDILLEYQEIFEWKFGIEGANLFVSTFYYLSNVNFSPIYFNWNLIDQDKSDNKFVDCYIASNSDYLVTEDHHFDVVKNIGFSASQYN